MRIPRILLAAPSSGSGKTVLACALMKALEMRGKKELRHINAAQTILIQCLAEKCWELTRRIWICFLTARRSFRGYLPQSCEGEGDCGH